MAIEFSGGLVLLLLTAPIHLALIPYKSLYPTETSTWWHLIMLSILCTTIAYTFSIKALRHVSTYTAGLSINLEPIYGIVLAYYFFQENKELSPGFLFRNSDYCFGCFFASSVKKPILKLSHYFFKKNTHIAEISNMGIFSSIVIP